MDLFEQLFQNIDEDLTKAKNYVLDPNAYVREHHVKINGKMRTLRAYKEGPNGTILRCLHQRIARLIEDSFTSADSSFAYKKGFNVLSCLEKHKCSSTFLKSDIHAYFDSISYENMIKKVATLPVFTTHAETLSILLQACFYENKLPLGFCSSPILSDLYLTELDRKFENIPSIVYTRYADDFIISSSMDNAEDRLREIRDELWDELENYQLDLNEKKTYIHTLKQTGDCFHALGLNLVYVSNNQNRITVSDSYLRETCKELASYVYPTDQHIEKEVIVGKINFIRDASLDSYQKFKKLVKVKLGKELETLL